ncbi:MAG: sugar ABC transporter permease [Rhodothermales bacterium]|nr:sugar ABC transporter permease [Rhodothermales bacterium]MCA0268070.1 sugar ABC transporter permease [Bacteroidota bacterium]
MANTLTLLRPGRLDAEARTAYTMLLPVIVLFVLFQYYPILKTIGVSFFEYGLLRRTTPFVGLGHYIRQFHDPLFLSALANTLVFVAGTVAVGVVLALGFAVLVEKAGRWASVYRTLYFIPVVTSLMATAMIWRWLYAPNGLFNFLLGLVGVAPQPWLLSESSALACLMALTVWKNLGFDLILFSAALQAIPDDLYEAAHLDGSGPWQDFWYVTLPSLRPIVLLVTVTAIIRSFQVFTIVLAMTQGGPINATRTLVYHLYEQGIQYDEVGYASAAAVVLLVLIGGVTYWQMRLNKRFA